MAQAIPALEIRDLHKRYGSLDVLKGISLTANDGDVISILGSSGSGKSTFLRCINLLENPHHGQILFSGEALELKADRDGQLVAANNQQINRLRTQVGFVARTYLPVEIFFAAGLFYLVMTFILVQIFRWLERKLRVDALQAR